MRGRRFHPAMQRLLERKRAEKRALDNMHRFNCDPKRHPTSKRRKSDTDDTPSGRPFNFSPPPELTPRPKPPPERTSQLTLPDSITARPAGLYAAVQAEERHLARQKAKVRRRKALAIDAKCLKLAVEKVRKPQAAKPQGKAAEAPQDHERDVWHGRTCHPEDRTDQGGNYWTLFTPGIWKGLHAVLHPKGLTRIAALQGCSGTGVSSRTPPPERPILRHPDRRKAHFVDKPRMTRYICFGV